MFSPLVILMFATVLITESILVPVGPNRNGCPSNKIAPQRRTRNNGRTLGYFQELFVDSNSYRPQFDSSDDEDGCDESLAGDDQYVQTDGGAGAGNTGKNFGSDNRFFLNWFGSSNSMRPPRPPHHTPGQGNPAQNHPGLGYPGSTGPVRPTRPPNPSYPPTRPPYHSGGLLAQTNRPQRPQKPEYPSESLKPVYEDQSGDRPNVQWRPGGAVGGPSGAVVGTPSAHHQIYQYQNPAGTRPGRVGRRNFADSGIIGSFVDLLF